MAVEAVPQYLAFGGETVVKFPKYVVFKGDNDKYLAASLSEDKFLKFNTTDIGNGRVRNEVVEVGDGTGIVMLKSLHQNKFWRIADWRFIWADAETADSSDQDMLFEPIKVDDQRVSLRCLANNAICKRLTTDHEFHHYPDCLTAEALTLEITTIFRVEEPTLLRTVHSIHYDLASARMYDLRPGSLFKVTVTNPSDHLANLQVAYSYLQKKSTSWKRAVSFTTGVKTTFQAGIPFVADGRLDVSGSVTVNGEWGGTEEEQTTVTGTYSYTTPVGAGGTAEVMVMGVHAKCDVPFTYTQEDLHTTGETVVTLKDDGVFTGLNTTDIKFEVRYL